MKAPHNAIAGVGFFVHFSVLPASLAWAAFEAKNGASSEAAMRSRIETYRRKRRQQDDAGLDYKVGCPDEAHPDPVLLDWHNQHVFRA